MNTSNKTLLQILVEELPGLKNAPEEWEYVYQHHDKELRFSCGTVGIYLKQLASNHRQPGMYLGHPGYELIKVTRDQYEAALAFIRSHEGAKIENLRFEGGELIGEFTPVPPVERIQVNCTLTGGDGWISWPGGECPVDSDAIVEVKYRKPNPHQFNNDRAGDFAWSHDGFDGDIIAYRLVQPHEVKAVGIDVQRDAVKSNDAQLEADLNDCIGQPQSNDYARDEILYELANFAATTKTSLDIGVATEISIWLSGKGYRKQ